MSRNDQEIIDLFTGLSADQADWQRTIGFGEEGNLLREINKDVHRKWDALARDKSEVTANVNINAADSALRNYYIAKLALITTEVAEAIEEIRHNHKIDERYYSDEESVIISQTPGNATTMPKPEGVPSELADIVIRCLSLAGEANINLGEAIVEKLAYNETRAQKHGGKAI